MRNPFLSLVMTMGTHPYPSTCPLSFTIMFLQKCSDSSVQSVQSVRFPVMSAQSRCPVSDDQRKLKTIIQSRISPWLTPMVYPLLRHSVVPTFFGDITITGQEHIPHRGPVILAPTHRSRWDCLMTPYATGRHVTGRDLRFMVTADEMTGLQGWLIRQLGGFPVNPRQPAIASLRFGMEILKNQEMMVIFPEGAIFRDRTIHPLRPGLARLAIQAETSDPSLGVKIVPIDLHYCDPIPSWGTDVNIKIGQPLAVCDYCAAHRTPKASAKQLTASLTQALEALL